ncbi:MAG TPA: hypothetical protein VG326_14165 [Tepidisphaeraceae bacterium]|nr:hypothetical protein [Tepidisphaeraceae bacterium]
MDQLQGSVETSNGSAAAKTVRQLLSADKCKQAVELAKENHKSLKSAESEQLLVDAYVARIGQFQAKGAVEDARTLIKLVGERFPSHRAALSGLQLRAVAEEGNIDELVAPLAQPGVTPEIREAIESILRRHLVDLPKLVNCQTLPPDHPLRVSAAAVWTVFQAATAGPMTEQQVALPEVSRRSPLAGWKLFIRALAAFYRNDDEACRKSLDAIAPDAAVRRLSQGLLTLLDPSPAKAPTGIAAAIRQRVICDQKAFREALDKLESAYTTYDLPHLIRTIRGTIQACNAARPDLFERLRQHISVSCMINHVPFREIGDILGRARKNAYYWRLAAMGSEASRSQLGAVVFWERFLQHGVAEKMFAANGKEAAVIYRRMANVLRETPAKTLALAKKNLPNRVDDLLEMYGDQPPEIAALAPTVESETVRKSIDAHWAYRRASELWPDAATFVKWREWLEKSRAPEKQLQEMAEVWRRTLPNDPRAPLLLSMLAEARKALTLSLKYLADAEAIDAMNPEVRKTRVRLTLLATFRHFKDGKPHLVEKDIAELDAMAVMREGDRPALLEALRAALHSLRPDGAATATSAAQKLAERVGPAMAHMLMKMILDNSRMREPKQWPHLPQPRALEPLIAADAAARSYILIRDLSLTAFYPNEWNAPINSAIGERPCRVASAHLLAIGAMALTRHDRRQAYLAAGAGLESASGIAVARFLLLRAQGMYIWAVRRRYQCLRAATEIAVAANDMALIDAISTEADNDVGQRPESSSRLGEEVIAEIIKQERAAVKFLGERDEANKYVVAIDKPQRRTSFGGETPFEMFGDDDDYDDDDDFDDDDDDDDDEEDFDAAPIGFGSSGFFQPDASAAIIDLFEKLGGVSSAEEMSRLNPELFAKALQESGLIDGLDPQMLKELINGTGNLSPGAKKKKNR